MKPSFKMFFIAFVALGSLAGCLGPGLFSTKAPWDQDWGKRPDGTVYARDTVRNWQIETPMLQQLVEKEVAAESPPLNKISWPDYWTSYFIYLRKNQENPEKYIAFILDLRRRASLHDLPKN